MLKVLGAVIFLLASSGVSLAVEPTHPELRRFIDGGGEVRYLGHSLGVDGWMLTKMSSTGKTAIRYAYETSEGGLVLGLLMDREGNVETKKQLGALMGMTAADAQEALSDERAGSGVKTPGAQKSGAGKAEKLYSEVESSFWARAGSEEAPYLYLFINTTCPECQNFWGDLKESVQAGRLQVRLVPFGALAVNRESGAALLSSDNPGEDWDKFIAGDAAVLSKDKADASALEKIDANTRLAASWKLQGPPFILYRKPSDGVVTAIVGEPENLMLMLADLMEDGEGAP